MHIDELKLIDALEEFSITSRFWGSKIKKSTFEENKPYNCVFYHIEAQVITNPSSRLEKKHQLLEFLFMTDF